MIKQYDESTIHEAAKESVAQEVLSFAYRLAERSNMIASRVHDKLYPVMLLAQPSTANEKVEATREYSPLFNDLRDQMWKIESALYDIESAISRTTL